MDSGQYEMISAKLELIDSRLSTIEGRLYGVDDLPGKADEVIRCLNVIHGALEHIENNTLQ